MVKRNMKKILSVLLVAICLFGLTACSGEEKELSTSNQEAVESISAFLLQSVYPSLDADTIQQITQEGAEGVEYIFSQQAGVYVEGNGFMSSFDSWTRTVEEAGALQSVGDYTTKYSTKGDTIIVDVDLQFEKRGAVAEFIYDTDLNKTLTSVAFNINYTLGEKMKKAGLNTLIGMGTVFVVLILLSLLIGCFGLFSKTSNKKSAPKTVVATAPAAPAVVETVEEDDSELVAVISAAIAQYEAANGGSADGYVVRSIVRRSNNKWKKN